MNQLTRAWKQSINIAFPHGILRPLVPEDVHEAYIQGLNDPDVNRYLVTVRQQVQTAETVQAFVRANRDDPDAVLFGIWIYGISVECRYFARTRISVLSCAM